MAWKWNEVSNYIVAVGAGIGASSYGSVQLNGTGFYALLKFQKVGPLPPATAPIVGGVQRFYGFLDFAQMSAFVDVLRNEKPVHLGFDDASPGVFHLMTGPEPVGEGET